MPDGAGEERLHQNISGARTVRSLLKVIKGYKQIPPLLQS